MLSYLKLQMARWRTLRAYKEGDWRKIPIMENNQPLIEVPSEISFPFYCRVLKVIKDERLFLRGEALEKVLRAREFLKSFGFDLMIYDGWRSLELQENLFWYYMKLFTVEKFGLGKQFFGLSSTIDISECYKDLSPEVRKLIFEANRTYVSWPTSDPLCPSPHSTGGAVDIWLYKDGEAENLGVPFDWMKDAAGAFYHLKIKRKRFSGNDARICRNRTMLLLSMLGESFTCYGPEVWHFNFGNQMDALVKGGVACYSYIEP